ncbi:plasminogen-like isoform X2 [Polyodon spathula]|uniref:plasminogen-like isoform X2 n=1 Tax=Polyodon spathula TaxID=7913 RepID=UPI001B7F75C0|nr:plasminogen-like isoform X2 [Polyodon spathula]
MVTCKVALLLFTALHSVTASILDDYIKTEGFWIFAVQKNYYTTKTNLECAEKCNTETKFTCRSFRYTNKDQECITHIDNRKTAQMLQRRDTTFYEKKVYLIECKKDNGVDYRGSLSKTASGKTCQEWASSTPHIPNVTPTTHPHADLESNFCRNPDKDQQGPWCYTTDPELRWEYCQIQDCNEECIHCSGEDYRGKAAKTESGYVCQRWDSQTPNSHGYLPTLFKDKYLEENYCRNPDGKPRPWCFTTNPLKRWESCSIPRCVTEPLTIIPEMTCATGDGSSYRGNISVTESGKTCQAWDADIPQKHSRTSENYPCKGLEKNYCRNPDNERMPWCYTTDPSTRWEYCKVPRCDAQPETVRTEPIVPPVLDCYVDNGKTYRGITSETTSGKKCQPWSSMKPHSHNKTPQSFPDADLRRNYCRNPDDDTAPWCYTTEPSVEREYCKIDKCPIVPFNAATTNSKLSVEPSKPEVPPQKPGAKECIVGNGEDYRGTTSVTVLGVTCQEWVSNTPHRHDSFTPQTHPDKGLDSNYCRNPDGDVNGPWCYTTDPNRKSDTCQIPKCEAMECGYSAVEPKRCFGRIVGGCVSNPYSWPWQISLRTSFNVHFCGGTLIHPQWVLTAAHCLERSSRPSQYKVFLGIFTEKADEPSKQVKDVDRLVLGPTGTDIALIKLTSPALLNDKVQPACLPEKDYIVPSGTECYVTGWGETQDTGGKGVLKEAGLPVLDTKMCNRPEYLSDRVKVHEMCAGNLEGGTDSCQNDSGGPLVCYQDRSFVLQGVTSWGLGCANAMKPGVYVRVSHFIDWIEKTMKIDPLAS